MLQAVEGALKRIQLFKSPRVPLLACTPIGSLNRQAGGLPFSGLCVQIPLHAVNCPAGAGNGASLAVQCGAALHFRALQSSRHWHGAQSSGVRLQITNQHRVGYAGCSSPAMQQQGFC